MTDKDKEIYLRDYRVPRLVHRISLRVSEEHYQWLLENWDPEEQNLSQLIRKLINAIIAKGLVLNDGKKIGGNQNEVESVKK